MAMSPGGWRDSGHSNKGMIQTTSLDGINQLLMHDEYPGFVLLLSRSMKFTTWVIQNTQRRQWQFVDSRNIIFDLTPRHFCRKSPS